MSAAILREHSPPSTSTREQARSAGRAFSSPEAVDTRQVRMTTAQPAVARARRAPPEFATQVVQSLPELLRAARRLGTQAADAHDLVQETCRRALEAHERFIMGSDLRAWLFCILRNLHRDRARRTWRELPDPDGGARLAMPAIEERPLWVQISDDEMAQALASLPPRYREPYVLHALHHYPYTDISLQLGIPCGTVGTRILRARLHLRRFLLHRLASRAAADGSDPI